MKRNSWSAISGLTLALLVFAPAQKSFAAGDTITGKITYSGTAPVPKKLKMDADPFCASQHPEGAVSQDVLLGPDNGLQNVLIYVKAGLPAATQYAVPAIPVQIDQKGCIYSPRIAVAMVNQPIQFTNSDKTKHHVQAMAEMNPEWMTSQDAGSAPQGTKFAKPEVGMLVICHLHPWMRMFVHVLANPYYAVTGTDGTFTIKGLPPGEYTVEAWHEKFGTMTMKVKTGGHADMTFTE
ncbi:MAG: carboxypeptidase regulatory-like domain-containing protein [Terriglobia bacterium]